jgi:ribose transport system ATP-binding protein
VDKRSDTQPGSLLSVSDVYKSYNGVPALINASIDLRSGEVHALMGENGAGKSTLIKLLAGVLTADSMRIKMRGQPVTIRHAQDALNLGLRFIHQELNVIPQLSVAENIFLGRAYPNRAGVLVNWQRLNDMARAILEKLGVTHINPRNIMARLSPGDQMLVSIARAFVGDDIVADDAAHMNATVYVMDEPTAALTGKETVRLFEVIDRLRERGSAVLYVSHRLEEVFKIADRVTVLRDGRLVDTRLIKEITPNDVIRMMTGRALQQVYPQRETAHGDQIRLEVLNLRTPFVSDVSFELAEGQVLGIAGLSGSGRTELLRGLLGADRRLGGQIILDGKLLLRTSPSSAWEWGIAFVPEERRSQGLVLSHSVSNNITLPQLQHLSHRGVFLAHRLEHQTSRALGESVHLRATGPRQTVRELSGGNQQKVIFARALTRPPRVLLLDEPTRGVDVGAKMDIYAIIREISANGTGILLVSSDLPELLGMTDRIMIMRDGRLADNVPTEGLTEETLLALCYGEIQHERVPTTDE